MELTERTVQILREDGVTNLNLNYTPRICFNSREDAMRQVFRFMRYYGLKLHDLGDCQFIQEELELPRSTITPNSTDPGRLHWLTYEQAIPRLNKEYPVKNGKWDVRKEIAYTWGFGIFNNEPYWHRFLKMWTV